MVGCSVVVAVILVTILFSKASASSPAPTLIMPVVANDFQDLLKRADASSPSDSCGVAHQAATEPKMSAECDVCCCYRSCAGHSSLPLASQLPAARFRSCGLLHLPFVPVVVRPRTIVDSLCLVRLFCTRRCVPSPQVERKIQVLYSTVQKYGT